MVKVLLHKGFLESLSDLSPSEQDQVRDTVYALMDGVRGKGLRAHKVGAFWSYSSSMNLRIMAWHAGENVTLLHVNHHDLSYRWAERTRAATDDEGQVLTLSAIQDGSDASHLPAPVDDTIKHAAERYLLLGISAPVARMLASVTDQGEWLEIVSYLAPMVQERALTVRCAEQPLSTDTLPSDIVLLQDEEAMKFALRLPTELWRVFLHPQQRFVVEMPTDRHILLRGGPGVGKSVTLVHRFVKIARSDRKPPALLALNDPVRRVLQESLDALDCMELATGVITADDFPKGRSALIGYLKQFSSLLIDEGQDLNRGFLSVLLEILAAEPQSVPPLFIAYDANQALSSPSGDALERFASISDSVRLTYSYRCTSQNAEAGLRVLSSLHERFVGRDFQHSHEINAARDTVSATYVSATSGPAILCKHVSSVQELCYGAGRMLAAFDKRYANSCSKAVIVIGDEVNAIRSLLKTEMQAQGIMAEVLTPGEAKGREFFAGIVVDWLLYDQPERPMPPAGSDGASVHDSDEKTVAEVTQSQYRKLAGLYVGVSRSRDRIVCLCRSQKSPLMGLENQNGK